MTKRRYRIIENLSDERCPLALVDEHDTIVRVSDRVNVLSALAFEVFNADEVEHRFVVTTREDTL
jgi:hypothetical protein